MQHYNSFKNPIYTLSQPQLAISHETFNQTFIKLGMLSASQHFLFKLAKSLGNYFKLSVNIFNISLSKVHSKFKLDSHQN